MIRLYCNEMYAPDAAVSLFGDMPWRVDLRGNTRSDAS